MLKNPNTVFVGSKFNAAGTSLAAGDVVLINANTGAVLAATDIATTDAIQLGFVKSTGAVNNIKKTGVIKKSNIKKSVYSAYATKVEASSVVTIANNSIVAGKRYVVRIVYKDIYEHPGQFTHSYEAFSTTASTNATIVSAIAKSINAHKGARVNAYSAYFSGTVAGVSPAATIVATGAVTEDIVLDADSTSTLAQLIAAYNLANPTITLTLLAGDSADVPTADITVVAGKLYLTAKEVVLNGFSTAGKEAISPYSQVEMDVFLYYTDPAKPLTNVYEPVVGATVVTTKSKPGKGNPYIVRDREQDALGYKGITFRTTWPIIKPELNVNLAKSYDTLVTEYTVNYQSPDNQYVKGTDLTAEVYIDNSAASGSKASDLNTAISTTWFA